MYENSLLQQYTMPAAICWIRYYVAGRGETYGRAPKVNTSDTNSWQGTWCKYCRDASAIATTHSIHSLCLFIITNTSYVVTRRVQQLLWNSNSFHAYRIKIPMVRPAAAASAAARIAAALSPTLTKATSLLVYNNIFVALYEHRELEHENYTCVLVLHVLWKQCQCLNSFN